MISHNRKELLIFQNFRRDLQLPKFKSIQNNISLNVSGIAGTLTVSAFDPQTRKAPSWWSKLWKKTISVEEFFHSVKNSVEELAVINERLIGYKQAIQRAENAGQTALVEKINNNIDIIKSETQMAALGLTKYIEEQSIIKYAKQTSRGVRLDWLANFTRFVPKNLIDIKKRADELHIFDNYAVMHFDPDDKSWKLTQKEINDKKDPILFGVLEHSRKLYYIGDWIDDFCDLTLEKIVEIIGKDEIKDI